MIPILLLLLLNQYASTSNILFASIAPAKSVLMWHSVLVSSLINKGHNVTFLTAVKDQTKAENYTTIFVEGPYESVQKHSWREMTELSTLGTLFKLFEICTDICKSAVESQGLRDLEKYPSDFFDLIILDITNFMCLLPLIHRFNYPPTLGTTTWPLPPWIASNFGNHIHPGYLPWYGLPYTQEMTFNQRFWNYIFMYTEFVLRNMQFEREIEEGKRVFGENVPPFQNLIRHISLVLTNSDPLLTYPQELAPQIVTVGGIHTKEAKKLPRDLETIMDQSKHGVILFSLGTIMPSSALSNSTKRALLEAFRMLPETVIWKFESEITDLPPNVFVRNWLPQNDILGHPKVKVFIGHAGSSSTQESLYHGVPMLCIPFVYDQKLNARNIVTRKLGQSINLKEITAQTLFRKIRELLDDPIYSKNMKTLSAMFKTQKETPLERALFWVEYVLQHGNNIQLFSSPARDLPFYVTSGLDFVGFLIVILIILCLCVYQIFRLIRQTRKLKTE